MERTKDHARLVQFFEFDALDQAVLEDIVVRHGSNILSAKAQRRRALAALSWEEKVAIVEQMRVLLPKGLWKDRTVSADEETDKRMKERINR